MKTGIRPKQPHSYSEIDERSHTETKTNQTDAAPTCHLRQKILLTSSLQQSIWSVLFKSVSSIHHRITKRRHSFHCIAYCCSSAAERRISMLRRLHAFLHNSTTGRPQRCKDGRTKGGRASIPVDPNSSNQSPEERKATLNYTTLLLFIHCDHDLPWPVPFSFPQLSQKSSR